MMQAGQPPTRRRNFQETVAFESITVEVPALNLRSDYSKTIDQRDNLEGEEQFVDEGETGSCSNIKPQQKQKSITSVTSPIYKVGELEWRIEVHEKLSTVKTNEEDQAGSVEENYKQEPQTKTKKRTLDLYIYCNEECRFNLWLCTALFTVNIEQKGHPPKRVSYTHQQFYGVNTYSWALPDIFELDDMTSQVDAHQPPISIKFELKVCRAARSSFPPLDTNLVVNYSDTPEIVPVNKYILFGYSPFFRDLFTANWDAKFVEIDEDDPDFDFDAFKCMLFSAMTMGWTMQEEDFLDYSLVYKLLKLSAKYEMGNLVDYCEKYLIDNIEDHSKMELLELAEKYGLVGLREHCLNEIDSEEFFVDLRKNLDICSRLMNSAGSTLNKLENKLGIRIDELMHKWGIQSQTGGRTI